MVVVTGDGVAAARPCAAQTGVDVGVKYHAKRIGPDTFLDLPDGLLEHGIVRLQLQALQQSDLFCVVSGPVIPRLRTEVCRVVSQQTEPGSPITGLQQVPLERLLVDHVAVVGANHLELDRYPDLRQVLLEGEVERLPGRV